MKQAGTCLIVVALCCCAGCSSGDRDRAAIEASLADPTTDALQFYATQSPTTDPGEYAGLLDGVPVDAAGIVRTVQGVLIRVGVVEEKRDRISSRRIDREVNIGTVRGMLERIVELDDRPLTEPRPQHDRLVAICAQHAMLTTTLLRHHGIPARARGGFDISETRHHDHWITEYWDAGAARWVRVDAEIDLEGTGIDGLDLSDSAFLTGASAWRLCRLEEKPPDHFGIWGGEWIGGWEFVLNELLLDFNAVNKVESLPWDEMELTNRGYDRLTEEERSLLDQVADVVMENDVADFERIRHLFRSNPKLRKPY